MEAADQGGARRPAAQQFRRDVGGALPDLGLRLLERRGGPRPPSRARAATTSIRASAIRPSACSRTAWPRSKAPRLPRHLDRHVGRVLHLAGAAQVRRQGRRGPPALRSCHYIVGELLPKYGITGEFVDGGDLAAWEKALSKPTQAVLFESPSNPMLDIVDVKAVCDLARKGRRQGRARQCLRHADPAAAAGMGRRHRRAFRNQVYRRPGPHPGRRRAGLQGIHPRQAAAHHPQHPAPSLRPVQCWVLVKGLETLGLRVERHCANAARVADALAAAPRHRPACSNPGRKDHPQHALAMKQMSAAGGVVTFDVKAGKWAAFETLNRHEAESTSPTISATPRAWSPIPRRPRTCASAPRSAPRLGIGRRHRPHLGRARGCRRHHRRPGAGAGRLTGGRQDVAGAAPVGRQHR